MPISTAPVAAFLFLEYFGHFGDFFAFSAILFCHPFWDVISLKKQRILEETFFLSKYPLETNPVCYFGGRHRDFHPTNAS